MHHSLLRRFSWKNPAFLSVSGSAYEKWEFLICYISEEMYKRLSMFFLAAGGNFEPVKEEDDEYDAMIREKKKLENAQSSEK